MESTKIQEFDLDPNCGFAKEETAQAIREDVQGVLGAVGNGVVPQFRSPISVSKMETGVTEFSGTGKGVLFVGASSNLSATITIDGVQLCSDYGLSGNGLLVQTEFTQSFFVKLNRSDYSRYIWAVFY